MTPESLEAAIRAEFSEGAYFYWDEFIEEINDETVVLQATPVSVRVIERVDGGEGDYQRQVYAVFEVTTDEGVEYFRIDGQYQSYDGTTWNKKLKKVQPTPKTIVEYI